MSSTAADGARKRRGLDVVAVILLLVSAFMLSQVNRHLAPYGSYNSYEFFERLRIFVCAAWVVAAIRFYDYRWFPATILGAITAWLFNPILQVTMSRYQWEPYDRGTLILSLAAAVAIGILYYRGQGARIP